MFIIIYTNIIFDVAGINDDIPTTKMLSPCKTPKRKGSPLSPQNKRLPGSRISPGKGKRARKTRKAIPKFADRLVIIAPDYKAKQLYLILQKLSGNELTDEDRHYWSLRLSEIEGTSTEVPKGFFYFFL